MREISSNQVQRPASAPYRVVDANYKAVVDALGRVLNEYPEFCGCIRCRFEVVAAALNYLSPHYYVEAGYGGYAYDQGVTRLLIENAIRIAVSEVKVTRGRQGCHT